MAEKASFFGDDVPPKLKFTFILRTHEMLAMHQETTSDLRVVDNKLKDILEISSTSLKTRRVVVELCNIVATHGARLAAAGILGVLKKMGRAEGGGEKTVIAMDGGVYEHYTEYRKCLESTLNDLVGQESASTIQFQHSTDGSGIVALSLLLRIRYTQTRINLDNNVEIMMSKNDDVLDCILFCLKGD